MDGAFAIDDSDVARLMRELERLQQRKCYLKHNWMHLTCGVRCTELGNGSY